MGMLRYLEANFSGLPVQTLRLCLWLAILMAIFVPLEKRWGLARRKIFRKEFSGDLAYYFLNGLIPNLLLIVPMSLIASSLHRLEPDTLYAYAASIPLWARLPMALVVGEIGFYWGHRWSHEIPLLWRFHAIHHSAEEIDWLVNTRAHPIDIAFTRLCGFIPMYALGLAQPMGNRLDLAPVLVTLIGTIWGFFIHANLKWRLGWIEWMVSSPGFHHWHHTNDSPDVIDKNFASMLPWIDKCFGTLYLPKRWPSKYGTDAHVGSTFARQLLLVPSADRDRS